MNRLEGWLGKEPKPLSEAIAYNRRAERALDALFVVSSLFSLYMLFTADSPPRFTASVASAFVACQSYRMRGLAIRMQSILFAKQSGSAIVQPECT